MTQSPSKNAAQYVRMSTEHQQYSTVNQRDAIAAYANARGISIVATYEDSGKSGLTLTGRPSLRRLIADVVGGTAGFDTILVYDISRWGRFQDADESAHLEYLCRASGVHVEYCNEPFSNDGTPFASIFKVVKRALAAEYSRELSEKVYAGKWRLITLGFRQGGSAGYGLRRCLIDTAGRVKGLLERGEYKSIATDRIILVPGPPAEVAVVRRIFHDYVRLHLGSGAIAASLNAEGIRSESGRRWSEAVVKRVLTSEKYVGDSIWGRQSFKLRGERRDNPPETWARHNGAFEGIIDRTLFGRAQRVRASRARQVSDEEIVERLRTIHAKHGTITTGLLRKIGVRGPTTIRKRFGSLLNAYAQSGYKPERDLGFIALNGAARRLQSAVATALVDGVRADGGTAERLRGGRRYLVNGEITVAISVMQQRRSQRGNPRWHIKRGGSTDDLTIAVLMDDSKDRANAYYVLPPGVIGNGFLIGQRNPAAVEAFRCENLDTLVGLLRRCQPAATAWRRSGTNEKSRVVWSPVSSVIRGFRSHGYKSYSGAFYRAATETRDAIVQADTAAAHLDQLRKGLAPLLVDARIIRLLARNGIADVPACAFADGEMVKSWRSAHLSALAKQRDTLLNGQGMTLKAWSSFAKLIPERQRAAAELMVLAGDVSEYLARALVAATPEQELADWPRKHIYGPRQKELNAVVEEGQFIYREGKRALTMIGPTMVVCAILGGFVRRLLMMPDVVACLESDTARTLRKFVEFQTASQRADPHSI